ncbi:MAG: hypothetical protein ALECFALPRED_004040 [Alectoria fallacina]|uniref:F-box domain-containing protein n=1 Tax=Alectoria fallacina TaxID=1903189 RepID=A0A8H3EJM2_9LECA|nr:MAG: hypothetical protein ALECFALPRED_004040 [Alectoria fallacina]
MASSSLSDFPAELILTIYESFDDHHTITAFNLASRMFYDVWRLNTASIAESVLSQSIDCFDLAQELLVVQGRSTGGQPETREGVLERSKHLIANALMVRKDYICTSTGVLVPKVDLSDPLLFFDGRERSFTEYHYRVWMLLELFNDREALDLRLQAATLEELQWIDKANRSFFQQCGQCSLGRFGFHELYHTFSIIKAEIELRESLS